MSILQTLSTTLPVILIVATGLLLRRIGLVRPESINDLKKLVVNLTLPLLLFKAFATMQFETRYLLIIGGVFGACLGVMLLVGQLKRVPGLGSRYAPFLMTGFEAGMLGYALFSAIYGEANIPKFAVIDLGQVLFVFLILIPRLAIGQGQKPSLSQTLIGIVKTPVIVAIVLGMTVNLFRLYPILAGQPLTYSVLKAAEMLAGLTASLVALIIGFELNFQPGSLVKALQLCLIRLVTWVLLALAFNTFIVQGMLGLDSTFAAAVMIMAILPAPFVIPLYLREGEPMEKAVILNVLSLGILFALAGSMVVKLLYGV
jgi:predicted permease